MKNNTILPKDFSISSLITQSDAIKGMLVSILSNSICPLCGVASARIHSLYSRTVAELPWSGVTVEFHLQVKKFFCDNVGCARRIFTERLPSLARPYGRKTYRLEKVLRAIAFAEGGESGARTALELGIKVSADSLLYYIRTAIVDTRPIPKVLGVDDFALRKGHRYGTILVDLETHTPIEILPERSAESFANWLKQHPGVEIISRDRGQYYAAGGKEGAPTAQHVADRFHLLKNLTETVERFLISHYQSLKAAAQALATENESTNIDVAITTIDAVEPQPPLIHIPSKSEREHLFRRERRLSRYQDVVDLAGQGLSKREIARTIGLSRNTVKKYLQVKFLPEYSRPKRRMKIDPFLPHLKERWQAGQYNSVELYQEIKVLGFSGAESSVRRAVASWRKELPPQVRQRRGPVPKATQPTIKVPSSRQTVFWLLDLTKEKDEHKRRQQEEFANKLCSISEEIKAVQQLGKYFIEIVRGRKSAEFDQWVADVVGSGNSELKNFVEGLLQDREAVMAALTLPYSNGQVEGQVNRLKFLKRAMYGRAKPDLLRARVLYQPSL